MEMIFLRRRLENYLSYDPADLRSFFEDGEDEEAPTSSMPEKC